MGVGDVSVVGAEEAHDKDTTQCPQRKEGQ